jgi:hypothetical protein
VHSLQDTSLSAAAQFVASLAGIGGFVGGSIALYFRVQNQALGQGQP